MPINCGTRVKLGREDRLDADGLRRVVASINRYLGEGDAEGSGAGEAGDGLTVVESRPAGAAWLLDGLWRQLGVDKALGRPIAARHRAVTLARRGTSSLTSVNDRRSQSGVAHRNARRVTRRRHRRP